MCVVMRMVSPTPRVIILRTHKYLTLYSKKSFADEINLKSLRWGDYPRYVGGHSIVTKVFKSAKGNRHEGCVGMEEWSELERCWF